MRSARPCRHISQLDIPCWSVHSPGWYSIRPPLRQSSRNFSGETNYKYFNQLFINNTQLLSSVWTYQRVFLGSRLSSSVTTSTTCRLHIETIFHSVKTVTPYWDWCFYFFQIQVIGTCSLWKYKLRVPVLSKSFWTAPQQRLWLIFSSMQGNKQNFYSAFELNLSTVIYDLGYSKMTKRIQLMQWCIVIDYFSYI